MRLVIAFLTFLVQATALGAVPKNVEVTTTSEYLTLNYSQAPWKGIIRGIDIYSCTSVDKQQCRLVENRIAPPDFRISIDQAGLWLVEFVVGIDHTIFGAARIVKWRQYVSFNRTLSPLSTQDIVAVANRYQPSFSFSSVETHFPINIGTALNSLRIADLEENPTLRSGVWGLSPDDKLTDLMRFNGDFTSRVTLKKSAVESLIGSKSSFPIYWTYELTGTELYVTYTLFFGTDKKESGIGNHALDRESITVVLSRVNESFVPSKVVYGAHIKDQTLRFLGCSDVTCVSKGPTELVRWTGDGAAITWDVAPRMGDQPIAYVAKGTHAMYPAFGFYEVCVVACTGLSSEFAGDPNLNNLRNGYLEQLDIGAVLLNHLAFSGEAISVSTVKINSNWNRLAPFVRNTALTWVGGASDDFSRCISFNGPCATYRHIVLSNFALSDTFSSPNVDSTKWNNHGYKDFGGNPPTGIVSIDPNGIAQFPAWGALSTKGKVSFSGSKIVIESRMSPIGATGEARIVLADFSTPSNQVMLSNTPYCGWGINIQAQGVYRQSGTNAGCGANIPVPFIGGWTNQFLEYRWTIEGASVLVEAGPSLGNITQSLRTTLGSSVTGKNLFLVIGTGATVYSPGVFDWVRVSVDQPSARGILNPANGHRYGVLQCGTWMQCRDAAQLRGGKLATIRGQAENDWLVANILPLTTSTSGMWIGMHAPDFATWTWHSGEAVSYTNWSLPAYSNGFFYHVRMETLGIYRGMWVDVPDTSPPNQAIVEYLN